jgi:hypothetical protein
VNQHLLEVGGRLLDVAVVDLVALAGISLTGLLRIGSGVLSEDHDAASAAHGFEYTPRALQHLGILAP